MGVLITEETADGTAIFACRDLPEGAAEEEEEEEEVAEEGNKEEIKGFAVAEREEAEEGLTLGVSEGPAKAATTYKI